MRLLILWCRGLGLLCLGASGIGRHLTEVVILDRHSYEYSLVYGATQATDFDTPSVLVIYIHRGICIDAMLAVPTCTGRLGLDSSFRVVEGDSVGYGLTLVSPEDGSSYGEHYAGLVYRLTSISDDAIRADFYY